MDKQPKSHRHPESAPGQKLPQVRQKNSQWQGRAACSVCSQGDRSFFSPHLGASGDTASSSLSETPSLAAQRLWHRGQLTARHGPHLQWRRCLALSSSSSGQPSIRLGLPVLGRAPDPHFTLHGQQDRIPTRTATSSLSAVKTTCNIYQLTPPATYLC